MAAPPHVPVRIVRQADDDEQAQFYRLINNMTVFMKAQAEAADDDQLVAANANLATHLDRVSASAARSLEASRGTIRRAGAAISMAPMSIMYPAGIVTVMPEARTYTKFNDFTGAIDKKEENVTLCLDWLKRVLAVCATATLSYPTALLFMSAHASGCAGRTIDAEIADGKDFYQVVLAMETNYCLLKHPELALEECRNLRPLAKEPLHIFAQRIRHLATMAYRNKPADIRAEFQKATMTESFRNALPPKIRDTLSERITTRITRGDLPMVFSDIVSEVTKIEQEQAARTALYARRTVIEPGQIRTIDEADADEPQEQAQGSEDHEEAQILAIFRGNRNRNRNNATGARPKGNAQPAYYAQGNTPNTQTIASYEQSGDTIIYRVQEDGQQKRYKITPRDVNVGRDECMKCGLKGHRCFGNSSKLCSMEKFILQHEACPKCKKGGHLAKECIATLDLAKN